MSKSQIAKVVTLKLIKATSVPASVMRGVALALVFRIGRPHVIRAVAAENVPLEHLGPLNDFSWGRRPSAALVYGPHGRFKCDRAHLLEAFHLVGVLRVHVGS